VEMGGRSEIRAMIIENNGIRKSRDPPKRTAATVPVVPGVAGVLSVVSAGRGKTRI
jgi:hypothetical protein